MGANGAREDLERCDLLAVQEPREVTIPHLRQPVSPARDSLLLHLHTEDMEGSSVVAPDAFVVDLPSTPQRLSCMQGSYRARDQRDLHSLIPDRICAILPVRQHVTYQSSSPLAFQHVADSTVLEVQLGGGG
eukprot:755494-Hanusia_phi.AAC.9